MQKGLAGLKRTNYCGEITKEQLGQKVTVMGWAAKNRDLGGVLFIDLRDRTGIVQVVFNDEISEELFHSAEKIRSEFAIGVEGTVRKRSAETVNPNLKTGEVEIIASNLVIYSKSETPPFYIEDGIDTNEQVRLKYRYLDLRRPEMLKNIELRHKACIIARDYYDRHGFLEIETPMLVKSTPEGARDYLVPSRVHHGAFYALPQSPQLYKQILMVSGVDRYFQIARCFRDEDLRADRQPEFTQMDLEMSFVDEDDVMTMNEGMLKEMFKKTLNIDIETPFKRLTYAEAMDRFGSDKPDTRFGMELVNMSDIFENCGFKVFADAVKNGGSVRAITVKNGSNLLSRRDLDGLKDFVAIYRAKGLAWINITAEELKSPITKFLNEDEINAILKRAEAETGDIILFVADKNKVVFDSLGALRIHLAKKLDLIDKSKFNFLWVTEFPLLEYSEEEKRFVAMHHPFTAPMDEDIEKMDTDPGAVRAKAYDVILNGVELGGGSIRIYDQELQEKMFELIGISPDEARVKFGFLLDAFKYGVPPHGGMAYGLDRLIMLMTGSESIRDVMAFPKVQNASELMTDCPAEVDPKQLMELGINIIKID